MAYRYMATLLFLACTQWSPALQALPCEPGYADNFVPASQPPAPCATGTRTVHEDFQVNIDNLFGYNDWFGIFIADFPNGSLGGQFTHGWNGDDMLHVLLPLNDEEPQNYVAFFSDAPPNPSFLYDWTTPFTDATGSPVPTRRIRTYFRTDPPPPVPTPLPGTIALLALALAGLTPVARRGRRPGGATGSCA